MNPRSAGRKTIRLRDEQVEDEMGRRVQQITRAVVIPPRPKQGHTAEDALNKARKELELLQEFFGRDHSGAILALQYGSGEDVRTASLSLNLQGGMAVLLLRLLCVRHLALDYANTSSSYEQIPAKRRRHGSTEKFIEERGLPESQTKRALKVGQKFLDIERNTGIAGISAVLMTAWYMFEHLYSDEIERLVKLLLAGACPDLFEIAQRLSDFLSIYQRFYSRLVTRVIQKIHRQSND